MFKFVLMPLITLFAVSAVAEDQAVPESAEDTEALQPGEEAPTAELRDADGAVLDLASTWQDQPVVLVFYRGGWCPYCNTHLKDLRHAEEPLKELDVKLVAVSPDKPEKLEETAGEQELAFELLSDSSMEAAKAYGIAFKVDQPTLTKYEDYGIDLGEASGEAHNLLPVPSVFVIDTDGEIVFTHSEADYTKRLPAKAVVAAARDALQR